ncbi:haloacid dehalogenase superfamily, subfamily IA, variant 3 with third motif having DD or ED [Filimonas lacunae]|uniref:Haloacid dehalogenase superfamily, subfamily IA, variant 3 with third motif having DD or ED n=1 Tax=Filimonas lacunae TaxID=477680 RepID=A0A173MEX7_9BACT|nr:HAD family phosphatase [Filimonas lacunae]BAV06067.1 beta-phosphoglucomutase [Filimonas lacunae]SIT24504.1 haloacid dehalogenase superfamily, subfamily IA, variant 3 with third motif having DD or ED [Filimonas lacunae]
MIQPKAFLFDMNGTMIDDMFYHGLAWFDVLTNDVKANFTRAEVDKQMYGKNEEVLDRLFGKGRFSVEEVSALSVEKEKRYQAAYKPHLKLINGLDAFLKKAKAHDIAMAIGTAAISFNVDFTLDNLDIRRYFEVIVSADDVSTSKPHPETFTKCADLLKVPYLDCVVFEDAPKGVEAALNAGMKAVVITTMHPAHEFAAYPNVITCVADYTDPKLNALFQQ